MYAWVSTNLKGMDGLGKVLKNVRKIKMVDGIWMNTGNPAPKNSYAEMWVHFNRIDV